MTIRTHLIGRPESGFPRDRAMRPAVVLVSSREGVLCDPCDSDHEARIDDLCKIHLLSSGIGAAWRLRSADFVVNWRLLSTFVNFSIGSSRLHFVDFEKSLESVKHRLWN